MAETDAQQKKNDLLNEKEQLLKKQETF